MKSLRDTSSSQGNKDGQRLSDTSLTPKKQFGQNFLTSVPAKLAIVAAGCIAPNDTILEIGPGKGALTDLLVATKADVYAVEKDTDLAPYLLDKYKDFANFHLLQGDILEYEPLFPSYKLIANIPYYITGAILEKFLSATHQPTLAVLLVQKEVAVRSVARDNKESILSLSIKCYGKPAIIKHVSRGSFYPIPNVDSSILAITDISRKSFVSPVHEKNFFSFIKAGFSHKRKFCVSNMKQALPGIDFAAAFALLHIDNTARAEDLPLSTWLSLSNPALIDGFRKDLPVT